MNVLFINACVREESRTKVLADAVLKKLGGTVREENLDALDVRPLSGKQLAYRSDCVRRGDYSDEMFDSAKAFAAADTIVVAAPYWDLSHPAALKAYVEQIMVDGLVFRYENDRPVTLCRAKKLIYVSTAGGPVFGENLGYTYIKLMAEVFWGVEETVLFQAQGLDMAGADVEQILHKTLDEIEHTAL